MEGERQKEGEDGRKRHKRQINAAVRRGEKDER